MRRLFLSLALLSAVVLASLPTPGRAQMNEAQVAQALVGVWDWQDRMNGATVYHRLTLTGSGTFVYTSAMQTYQVTSSGGWIYQGGYLQFRTTSSTSLDPTGRPIGLGPIQILDVGRDYVRTPAGLARRSG